DAALDAYSRWGAMAKVDLLNEKLIGLALAGMRREKTPVAPVELDLLTLVKAGETLSDEVVLDRLLEKLMRTCLEAAGAQRGMLFIEEQGAPVLWAAVSGTKDVSLRRAPLAEDLDVPVSVIEHARRTGEVVVLGHAGEEGAFVSDPDVVRRAVKS